MSNKKAKKSSKSSSEKIKELIYNDDPKVVRSFFVFDSSDSKEEILYRFNIWTRRFFPEYHESKDADFHKDINEGNFDAYKGNIDQFICIAFRGAGKDVKEKLFIPFLILNDLDQRKKYFKVLSADMVNAKQSVTDIYNMILRLSSVYPETFEKTNKKREETMSSFTTTTGVKVIADSLNVDQRGAIQEENRPDYVWFNDFETRQTLRSAVITKAVWDNMEEARTGLQKGGCAVYTCNYISEMGNVHKLVTERLSERKRILIVPIKKDGKSTWEARYSLEDISIMEKTDDDFEGERMCQPNASKDIYFPREQIDAMPDLEPVDEIAGFKMFKKYNPAHAYAIGADVAGGVGLDSSASVVIDFSMYPAQVVGTYHSNTIDPEAFGDELVAQAKMFGNCLIAIENNKFDQTILKAKMLDANLYRQHTGKTIKVGGGGSKKVYNYGWNTNSLTKSQMSSGLRSGISDGIIWLNDPELKQEARSYTRNDVIDKEPDPRLVTRHFDLLTAAMIAWQMKDHVDIKKQDDDLDEWLIEQEASNIINRGV